MYARVFPAQPYIIAIRESGDKWQNDTPYIYETEDGIEIMVPKGYRSDGTSLARYYYGITGFAERGIHDPAWLTHDYLYEFKGKINGIQRFNRKQTDVIFLKMLKELGVKSWHARIAYLAVRAGGYFFWRD